MLSLAGCTSTIPGRLAAVTRGDRARPRGHVHRRLQSLQRPQRQARPKVHVARPPGSRLHAPAPRPGPGRRQLLQCTCPGRGERQPTGRLHRRTQGVLPAAHHRGGTLPGAAHPVSDLRRCPDLLRGEGDRRQHRGETLVEDAVCGRYDRAILISADSDLCPAIRTVRRVAPTKQIIAAFPPRRASGELGRTAHGFFTIPDSKIRKSLLPDTVTTTSGVVLKRPSRWT